VATPAFGHSAGIGILSLVINYPTAYCASNGRVDFAAASRSDSQDHSYRFLIHDRDSILSAELDQQLKAFGLRVLRTPARAPRQTPIVKD
jgi:hypothetical protein